MWTRIRLNIQSIPYFVTVNFYRRRRIFVDEKWLRLMIDIVKEQRRKFPFRFHEFVLMLDHYHAIITPSPGQQLGEAVKNINGAFARRFNTLSGNSGRVFQPDYYDHAIRDENDYIIKTEYIHNNPVKAGLAHTPTEYPWSSARNRLNDDNRLITLDDIDSL